MAAVPFDMVRFSLHDLWKLDKVQCSQMLRSYNGRAASAEPMTTKALALTVVLMMVLAFVLLCSGLRRLFGGRRGGTFNLVLRILLRITFVLFLPVLSSVFSLTKAQGGTGFLLTLLWLLLVELIRVKVQAMMLPADGSSFSRSAGRFTPMDHADEVGYMVWAGYLVFFNMGGHARDEAEKKWGQAMRAMFAILWLLSFLKLAQRIINAWAASSSWHTARNPLLIAAYMQHVSHSTAPSADTSPDDVMEMCQFVVEGEHKLVLREGGRATRGAKAQPVTTTDYGYGVGRCPRDQSDLKGVRLRLNLPNGGDDTTSNNLVTVGKVWQWRKEQNGDLKIHRLFLDSRGVLQDLCLSFSLFKLLRRRFEQYPMVEVGSDMARRVMLKGLLCLNSYGGESSADRPFRVLQLELDFLERYYQAADRVAVSSGSSYLLNILLSMLFVPIYLVAVWAILVTTKDADYFYCMALVSSRRLENFPFLSFFITMALLATLICFEANEFFTSYFNFNSNLVRLVCYYGTLQPQRSMYGLQRRILYLMFRIRLWIFSVTSSKLPIRSLTYNDIRIKQVSIVAACGPIYKLSLCTKEKTLAAKAKEEIIEAMKLIDVESPTISLPPEVGAGPGESTRRMATRSATEIILASHLATELFDMEQQKEKKWQEDGNRCSARDVATTLSRYCMYLVAEMPELLPDDEVWVSQRFKDMRTCLAKVVQNCCCGCMLCTPSKCCRRTMLDSLKKNPGRLDMMTRDAVELFDRIDRTEGWNQLAKFWAQLIIYLAPSNDVQGHAKAICTSGGDLITCLWAFCTHAGITRLRQPQELHGPGV
ncbi:uncharacterized protein C2845_PM17G03850 [Panicum miliaceum]|uniref:DUF4220 domain-containing protein n=1 Tax=Panicum miliaceum TaxID=4540 RepID=A0A3L6Q2K4_PANMI|nr:uncharacterized protein C2845_PM17G03850 [Panicum miliaceum]